MLTRGGAVKLFSSQHFPQWVVNHKEQLANYFRVPFLLGGNITLKHLDRLPFSFHQQYWSLWQNTTSAANGLGQPKQIRCLPFVHHPFTIIGPFTLFWREFDVVLIYALFLTLISEAGRANLRHKTDRSCLWRRHLQWRQQELRFVPPVGFLCNLNNSNRALYTNFLDMHFWFGSSDSFMEF